MPTMVPDRGDNPKRRFIQDHEDPSSRYQNPRYSGKKIIKEKSPHELPDNYPFIKKYF